MRLRLFRTTVVLIASHLSLPSLQKDVVSPNGDFASALVALVPQEVDPELSTMALLGLSGTGPSNLEAFRSHLSESCRQVV